MNLFAKNLREVKKAVLFQNKKPHNLETLGYIKNVRELSDISIRKLVHCQTSLLMNYGKLSCVSPKNWGSFYSKSRT